MNPLFLPPSCLLHALVLPLMMGSYLHPSLHPAFSSFSLSLLSSFALRGSVPASSRCLLFWARCALWSVFRCFLRSVCLTSLQCSFLSFLLLSCSPCCILLSYFSRSISKATIFSVCKVMPQRYLPGIYGSLRSDQWRSN